ncbi:TetR/AcrR family transcriptional regulator [Aeromicrobium sp. CTD01-1L150]|uniref:TetR/AcrR family transcriptional regulator n=1 Tax=Aeromicrobium sp. CTD01-1L150 TaxID=3341830 RepID=UPI0035C1AB38
MSERRTQILRTATELFARDGFHGVSVGDIGFACGISGPALYKHFDSKAEVLTQALTDISDELLRTGQARADAATDADARLDALIAWHLDFAVQNPAYIVVQEREWARLDDAGRTAVRRTQLAYVDLWVDVVRDLRDDLPRSEARAAVQATFGLLNSTPHSARISEPALRALLARMARAALLG